MNHTANWGFLLAGLLTLLGTGLASGQAGPPADGRPPVDGPVPAGIDAGRWQRLVGQLNASGLAADAVGECLAPVQEAARQGLPPDAVLARIEEGLAKRVEAKALQEAGRQRLANLRRAAAVLGDTGYGSRNTRHGDLMKSVALALESGISADTLSSVLALAGGDQAERMRSIVEAGETMRLNGLDEAVVRQMMSDFATRNMRRTEVMRASRFVVQQHHAHVEASRIREQLWDGAGAGGRWGGGRGTTGSGPGTGAGGPDDRHSAPPAGPGGAGPDSVGDGGAGGGSGANAGPQGSTQNPGRSR